MANIVDNYLTIRGPAADITKISELFSDSKILDDDLEVLSRGLFPKRDIKLKKGETAFFLNPGKQIVKRIDELNDRIEVG